MKKIFNCKSIPFVVIGCSIIGLLLRIWTQGDGPDVFGLYERMPLAWVVLWLFTAAVAAAIFVAVRPMEVSGGYGENYPKSVLGFIGYLLAGAAVLFYAYGQYQGPELRVTDYVTVYLGFAAGAVTLVSGVFRFLGKKPPFLLHGFLCLYLAVRLFNRCQAWSNEPQTATIMMPFLASLTLMLAVYHRGCFDVDMGKRSKLLLWTLLSTYLCVVAVLSFEEIMFYAAWAIWLMTNLCSLQPLKDKAQVEGAVPGHDLEGAPENMSAQEPETRRNDEEQ